MPASSGISQARLAGHSWTNALLWPDPATYISSCPKGQVEPPDRFEERSSGRSREPGSQVARPASEGLGDDQGLWTCSQPLDPSNGGPHQFLRALPCPPAIHPPAVRRPPARRPPAIHPLAGRPPSAGRPPAGHPSARSFARGLRGIFRLGPQQEMRRWTRMADRHACRAPTTVFMIVQAGPQAWPRSLEAP